jgi:hypothetical protein
MVKYPLNKLWLLLFSKFLGENIYFCNKALTFLNVGYLKKKKKKPGAGGSHQLATWEAEISSITVGGQPRKIV